MSLTTPSNSDPSTNPFDRNYVDPALNSTSVHGRDGVVYTRIASSSPINSPRAIANSPRNNSSMESLQSQKTVPSKGVLTSIANGFKTFVGIIAYLWNHRLSFVDACAGNNLWTLRGMLFFGKQTKQNIQDAMVVAYDNGKDDLVVTLARKNSEVFYENDVNFLHRAITEIPPRVELALKLIEAGIYDVNTTCTFRDEERTALSLACGPVEPNEKVINALLKGGATVEARDIANLILKKNRPDLAVKLIKQSSSAVIQSVHRGKTFLHRASELGSIPLIDALSEKGCDLNRKTSDREETPLHLAQDEATALHLISKGAQNLPNKFGKTPLMTAIEKRWTSVIEKINDHIDQISVTGETALYKAMKEMPAVVPTLLAKGAKNIPDTTGKTPLMIALKFMEASQIKDRIEDLKKEGPDQNQEEIGELQERLEVLCQESANIQIAMNGDSQAALTMRVTLENASNLVIEKSKDNLDSIHEGRTALHMAMESYPEAASTLMDNGAKNIPGKEGMTPLMVAILSKRAPGLIDRLIESGENLDEVTLRYAIHRRNSEAAIKLIEKGALNIPDLKVNDRKESLLIEAYKLDLEEVVDSLLTQDQDPIDVNELAKKAIQKGDLETIRKLAHKLLPDNLVSLISKADEDNQPAIIAFLVNHKKGSAADLMYLSDAQYRAAAVELVDTYQFTPEQFLEQAVIRGFPELIEKIDKDSEIGKQALEARLEKIPGVSGLEPEQFEGLTYMHLAAAFGQVSVMTELAKKGLSNAKKINGLTPLLMATQASQTRCVQSLLPGLTKVALADSDKSGATALHYAARLGNYDIFVALMQKDSNLAGRIDNQGKTPLHWLVAYSATEEGRKNINGYKKIFEFMKKKHNQMLEVKDLPVNVKKGGLPPVGKSPIEYLRLQPSHPLNTSSSAENAAMALVSSTMEANKRHQAWVEENNVGAFGWANN